MDRDGVHDVKIILLASFLAATSLIATGTQAATLDGDTVVVEHTGGFGPVFGPTNLLVGAGVELPIDLDYQRTMNLDLGGSLIDLAYSTTIQGSHAAFGTVGFAFLISGIDFGTGIFGIDVTFTEGANGTRAKEIDDIVTFTATSVAVNFQGNWEEGDSLSIALKSQPVMAEIPLPAGLPLLIGALAALGFIRCRT